MTNIFPINNSPVNDTQLPNQNLPLVSFDWLNLTDCTDIALIENDNSLDLANVNFKSYFSPRNDWGGVLQHNITDRNLEITLWVQWDTQVEYEQRLDLIKEKLTTTEWLLIYSIGWEFRQTKASITSMVERQDTKKELNRGVFDISFTCLTDWESFETVSQSYYNITSDLQIDLPNLWSKDVNPDIFFIFNNATSQNNITITTWWFTYTIPQSVSAGDVIVCYGTNDDKIREQNAVYNDTNIITTQWRYPILDKWSTNIIDIAFDGTVDVSITFVYRKKYY